MNKTQLAERINVDRKTLRNWETTKPELIKLIKLGIIAEEQIKTTEEYLKKMKETQKEHN